MSRAPSSGETLLRTCGRSIGLAGQLAMGVRAAQSLIGLVCAWVLATCITDVVFHHASLTSQMPRLGLLAGLYLFRAAVAQWGDHLAFRAGAAVRRHLFGKILDHATRLGPVRLADTPPGEIASLLMEGVNGTEAYWRQWMPALAQVAIIPIAILLIAFPMDWLTGVILFVTLPLLPVFMILAGRAAERASTRQWSSLLRMGGHLLDRLRGLTDLKILRASKRTVEDVARVAEIYRHDTMSVLRIAFLSALVLEFFATVSIAVVAVLVGFRLMWGDIDFLTGFFLLLLAPEFYTPLRAMGSARHARMEATAVAEKIADFLARPLPATENDDQRAPAEGTPTVSPAPRSDTGRTFSVTFDHVSAHYTPDRAAVNDMSFTVPGGERLALVGKSGAGKSTVFALLCGFVQPSAGRILCNGIPLHDLSAPSWRRTITMLPQHPHMFPATVAENIAMQVAAPHAPMTSPLLGRVDNDRAKIDRDRVWAALEAARADQVVRRLPDGLDTVLGEDGRGLSGGEAQRLMIARAFYAPTPLILCDEPTAHLDPATEEDLTAALTVLARQRTMITIAHRLHTIRDATRILVLSKGRLVEQGNHADLMARNGAYAALFTASETGRRPPAGPLSEKGDWS